MLLASLNELHGLLVATDRLPPIGYRRKRVRFLVDLDDDGRCLSVIDTAPDETVRAVPEIGRTSGVKPFLACDNGRYVLGLPRRVGDETRALRCHAAFLDLLIDAAAALDTTDRSAARQLRVVAGFVSDRNRAISDFRRHGIVFDRDYKGELTAAGWRIAFRVNGVNPVELPAVQDWWAEIVSDDLVGEAEGWCQVSGTRSRLARKMPGVAVKPGTPQALISANFVAAERYNASQSGGARIAVPVAIRSHQALNWLLADPHHHRGLGDLTFVWWLATDMEVDPFNVIARPFDDDVAAFLEKPWTGWPGLSPSDSFRLLELSLTEGRVVIRFDHVSTLAEIEQRTRRWLELIARPGRNGTTYRPTFRHLAKATAPPDEGNVRKARKDRAVEAFARAAVAGTPLPRPVLAALVGRCRAVPVPRVGDRVDWLAVDARLACLNLHVHLEEDRMGEIHTAAELCGRMLAQLDAAQRAALGDDVNRTIADRYYASASTMPKRVFAGLFKTASHHLATAGGSDGGKAAQVAISRRLAELVALLAEAGGWPTALGLEQQADFALGYWDERQAGLRRAPADTDETTSEEA